MKQKQQNQKSSGKSRIEKTKARRQELRKNTEKLRKKIRNASIKLDEALLSKMSQGTGLNLDKIFREVEKQFEAEHKKLRREKDLYKKKAKKFAARQRQEFDRELNLAVKRGGLEELIQKTYHNPALRMKLAFEWDMETSPPLGMFGGSGEYEIPTANADGRFEIIDPTQLDPNHPQYHPECDPDHPDFDPDHFAGGYGCRAFVDSLHPYCFASAGSDRRTGHASAWVTQRLTFEHDPPESQLLIDNVSVSLSAFGYGESDPSSSYFFTTAGWDAGGNAQLLMSVSVEQEYTTVVGRLETTHVDIVRETELSGFHSHGGNIIHLFFVLPAEAPEWGPVDLRHLRSSYPTMFPLYGTSNHREPLGGPVRVHVEFKCAAVADHRNAEAEIEFNEEGHRIKVHQVILESAG